MDVSETTLNVFLKIIKIANSSHFGKLNNNMLSIFKKLNDEEKETILTLIIPIILFHTHGLETNSNDEIKMMMEIERINQIELIHLKSWLVKAIMRLFTIVFASSIILIILFWINKDRLPFKSDSFAAVLKLIFNI